MSQKNTPYLYTAASKRAFFKNIVSNAYPHIHWVDMTSSLRFWCSENVVYRSVSCYDELFPSQHPLYFSRFLEHDCNNPIPFNPFTHMEDNKMFLYEVYSNNYTIDNYGSVDVPDAITISKLHPQMSGIMRLFVNPFHIDMSMFDSNSYILKSVYTGELLDKFKQKFDRTLAKTLKNVEVLKIDFVDSDVINSYDFITAPNRVIIDYMTKEKDCIAQKIFKL